MNIQEHRQGLNLGRAYFLYEIDLRSVDMGFIRIHPGDQNAVDHVVSFGGNQYSPYPIITDGWKISSQGRLPRPRFAIANTTGIFTPMIQIRNGLKRIPVTRIKTYERYLDGKPDADSSQHDPVEIYEINKLSSFGKVEGVESIEWELRTPIDKPGSTTPRIEVIKGPCQFSYRTFDGTNFVNGTCPYRGTETFDVDGNPTDNAGDVCAQTVPECVRRHGENVTIPYMGFINAGGVRRR